MTRNQLTTSERVELAAYRELFAEINRVTHHLNDGDLEQRWNTTPTPPPYPTQTPSAPSSTTSSTWSMSTFANQTAHSQQP